MSGPPAFAQFGITIHNVPLEISDGVIWYVFSHSGNVLHVKRINENNRTFVHYATQAEVDRAIADWNRHPAAFFQQANPLHVVQSPQREKGYFAADRDAIAVGPCAQQPACQAGEKSVPHFTYCIYHLCPGCVKSKPLSSPVCSDCSAAGVTPAMPQRKGPLAWISEAPPVPLPHAVAMEQASCELPNKDAHIDALSPFTASWQWAPQEILHETESRGGKQPPATGECVAFVGYGLSFAEETALLMATSVTLFNVRASAHAGILAALPASILFEAVMSLHSLLMMYPIRRYGPRPTRAAESTEVPAQRHHGNDIPAYSPRGLHYDAIANAFRALESDSTNYWHYRLYIPARGQQAKGSDTQKVEEEEEEVALYLLELEGSAYPTDSEAACHLIGRCLDRGAEIFWPEVVASAILLKGLQTGFAAHFFDDAPAEFVLCFAPSPPGYVSAGAAAPSPAPVAKDKDACKLPNQARRIALAQHLLGACEGSFALVDAINGCESTLKTILTLAAAPDMPIDEFCFVQSLTTILLRYCASSWVWWRTSREAVFGAISYLCLMCWEPTAAVWPGTSEDKQEILTRICDATGVSEPFLLDFAADIVDHVSALGSMSQSTFDAQFHKLHQCFPLWLARPLTKSPHADQEGLIWDQPESVVEPLWNASPNEHTSPLDSQPMHMPAPGPSKFAALLNLSGANPVHRQPPMEEPWNHDRDRAFPMNRGRRGGYHGENGGARGGYHGGDGGGRGGYHGGDGGGRGGYHGGDGGSRGGYHGGDGGGRGGYDGGGRGGYHGGDGGGRGGYDGGGRGGYHGGDGGGRGGYHGGDGGGRGGYHGGDGGGRGGRRDGGRGGRHHLDGRGLGPPAGQDAPLHHVQQVTDVPINP